MSKEYGAYTVVVTVLKKSDGTLESYMSVHMTIDVTYCLFPSGETPLGQINC
jgi:hypothetical protein